MAESGFRPHPVPGWTLPSSVAAPRPHPRALLSRLRGASGNIPTGAPGHHRAFCHSSQVERGFLSKVTVLLANSESLAISPLITSW